MGGIAVLAKQAGFRVTGCDANVYPPMSTQLEAQGIELIEGFGTEQLALKPDIYVIGNVVSRGNPLMEEILNRNLPYISGPQWLAQNLLQDKWVLAVAGTHGKTTTSSMLAWILEYAGLHPGFLIGGVPQNFGVSARLNPPYPPFSKGGTLSPLVIGCGSHAPLSKRGGRGGFKRAETPKFCGTPPIKNPGLNPAYSSIQANMEAVVVLPCVPATASTHLSCNKFCASHCGPEL